MNEAKRYEPHRYQVTYQGPEQDAVKKRKKELVLRQQGLCHAAAARRGASTR
ncbi:hypothetical protein ACFVYE_42330 [Streptomyces sp. NPDC058239]|uniref:hypothetical protein n=1 Tax=Streptomyces sp. NPDC058239 TaxID=3346395 RepID=UPI0036E5E605